MGSAKGVTMMYDREKEIDEALTTGNIALSCLEEARSMLNGAGGWGVIDILGGGMISTYMKHKKMRQAQKLVNEARNALRNYGRELGDVQGIGDVDVEVGELLRFADYFWDGFLADVMVQSKISKARREVDAAINRVRETQRRLNVMRTFS